MVQIADETLNYFCCCFRALINSLFLFSARPLLRDMTAQMAAGSQPIRVICRNKQSMP